jgi:predicted aspartyl protease
VNRRGRVASVFLLSLLGSFKAHGESHLARRLLTIPVEVNDIAGTFLIDTGADHTVIGSAFAQRLGLKPSGSASLERPYSTEESVTVTAEHLRVGPKLWSGVPLVVQDLSTLTRMQLASISGILGTDLLATMAVKLSYSSGSPQVIPDIGARGSLVALKKIGNRYFVPVRIGPSTLEMLLDTGTNMTALSSSAWRTLPSSWKPNDLVEGIQSSASPPGSFLACVPALHLGDEGPGGMVLSNQALRVLMPSQAGSFADPAFAGLHLSPDAEFHLDPYEFVTIGIQFFKVDANAFSVVAVWKHSPAEAAGVLVGDRILSVNGRTSADLGLEAFSSQLHGPAGTPVAIEVERATGKSILHMKMRQLVCESGVSFDTRFLQP